MKLSFTQTFLQVTGESQKDWKESLTQTEKNKKPDAYPEAFDLSVWKV